MVFVENTEKDALNWHGICNFDIPKEVMAMLVGARVDDRLLHGQVLVKWVGREVCSRIVVVDERARSDPLLKSLMRAALPRDIRLDICGISEGAVLLKAKHMEKERVFALFRTVETLHAAIQAGAEIRRVNLARPPQAQEKAFVRDFLARGIRVSVQMVPDSPLVLIGKEDL